MWDTALQFHLWSWALKPSSSNSILAAEQVRILSIMIMVLVHWGVGGGGMLHLFIFTPGFVLVFIVKCSVLLSKSRHSQNLPLLLYISWVYMLCLLSICFQLLCTQNWGVGDGALVHGLCDLAWCCLVAGGEWEGTERMSLGVQRSRVAACGSWHWVL